MKSKYTYKEDISFLQVKSYSQELIESINKLHQQLFPEKTSSMITQEHINTVLQQNNVWVYIAQDSDGKIVGTATIAMFQTPYDSRAIIEDVVVDKDYRGQGIATTLMKRMLAIAKNKGIKRVKLNSHPHRIAANAMYQGMGYELLTTNTYQMCL